jgi:hypothetical protein
MMVMCYRRSMPENHTSVIRSYSQLSTYGECAKRYELSYVRRIKRRPGVWFPAGTAFHATVQRYLLATLGVKDDNGNTGQA